MDLDDNIYKQILNLCNNGKFKLKIGKNKEAIPNYYGALAAEPSEPSNFYNYILSCTKNKQYKQAKDAYNTYFHLYKTADFNKKQLELFDYIKKYKP